MRESFVFHAEYIDDLPEECRSVFTMYTVNYGIYGKEPEVSGLEEALWKKIKRRIDSDIEGWERTRAARSKAGSARKNNTSQPERQLPECSVFVEQKAPEVVESVSEGVIQESSVPCDLETRIPLSVSEPQANMAKQIHEIFEKNKLPCTPFVSFIQGEFVRGMRTLHTVYKTYRLTSKDILMACENYASVVNDEKCYFSIRMPFDRFIENQKFRDFLPASFVKSNWRIWGVKEDDDKKECKAQEIVDICPSCGKEELRWSNVTTKYHCSSCNSDFEWDEILKIVNRDERNYERKM